MAVVNQNGISGISSFNAKGDGIQVFNSDGSAGSITGLSGVNVSGVITATTFTGDGSSLTGIASTDNIRTNTNATFLQNVNVLGAGITVGNTLIQSHSIGIGTTDTTGRNAGVTTSTGTLIYNTTTKAVEVFDGTQWIGGLKTFSATGGTQDTTSRSGYIVHTFTGPGSFVVEGAPKSVEVLVVGGGGGGGTGSVGNGGQPSGGGGGGGGVAYSSAYTVSAGTYPIVVGGGSARGGAGNDSTGLELTGSGGASFAPGRAGGASGAPQSNAGGSAVGTFAGGGGGGAGGAGSNGGPGPVTGGAGGIGYPTTITGISSTYGGGGNGAGTNPLPPAPGGGGTVNFTSGSPTGDGLTNRGGGGGGGYGDPDTQTSGGSGVVIIAYTV